MYKSIIIFLSVIYLVVVSSTAIAAGINITESIRVNNARIGITISGEDTNNPVLLHVHGAPNKNEIAITREYLKQLEKYFTVVYYDQRGYARSSVTNIPQESINVLQIVEDIKEVTLYLMQKLNKEKIYLLAQGWGSIIGMHTVNQYPDLYYAYIGVSQITNAYDSEKLALDFVKNKAKERNDKQAVDILANVYLPSIDASTEEWINFRTIVAGYYEKYKEISLRSVLSEEIISDPKNKFNEEYLYKIILKNNLFNDIQQQYVPIYIFHGFHDYNISYKLVQSYFEGLSATEKKLYQFDRSDNYPILQEYQKFENIIKKDILKISN